MSASCPQPCLIMVRHTAVCGSLKGVCYGASDVALSPQGLEDAKARASDLAAEAPGEVFHSGLARTRILADLIADRLSLSCGQDCRLAEFDFGDWELRRWDEIHADGHDIARLIHEPETFAPPGGETLYAMRNRVLEWYETLAGDRPVLAVAHGGPISVLRGTLSGVPPPAWPSLVPAYGEAVRFVLPR